MPLRRPPPWRPTESIVDGASARALLDGDSVASAALDAGVAHNIVVLQALAARLPDQATDAIDRAIQRAIDRSDEAVDTIHGRNGGFGGGGGNGGSGGTGDGAGNGSWSTSSMKLWRGAVSG